MSLFESEFLVSWVTTQKLPIFYCYKNCFFNISRILTFNLLRKIDTQKVNPNWIKLFRLKLYAKETKARPFVITWETGPFYQSSTESGSARTWVTMKPSGCDAPRGLRNRVHRCVSSWQTDDYDKGILTVI